MKAKKILESGDVSGIADLSLKLSTPVRKAVDNSIRDSYEAGKIVAAKSLNVDAPATSKQQTQLRKLEAAEIADQFETNLNNTAKATIRNAIAAGAAAVAIIPAVRDKIVDEASKMIMNIAGTVTGQNVNRGRKQVYDDNILKISKYQRSEVLDGSTCNMCLSLDKRIVKADDPVANMDLVHTNCRGVWVPILVEEKQPDLNPIPKTALNGFDMIDGRPVVNSFKQLKKPINKANAEVQEQIKKRLEK